MTRLDWRSSKTLVGHGPFILVWNVATETASPGYTSRLVESGLENTTSQFTQVVVVGSDPSSNICYAHDVFDFSELVCAADPPMRELFLAKPYSLFRAYGQSKLANLMMCRQLAWRLRQRGSRSLSLVSNMSTLAQCFERARSQVNCVHPGEVLTQVFNDFHPVVLTLYAALRPLAQLFFKTPAMGAVCTTFVAASPGVQVSGEYFMRCRPAEAPEASCCRSGGWRLVVSR
eukprot:s2790_g4.t1